MLAIEVKNVGVRFLLRHQKENTLRENFVNLLKRKTASAFSRADHKEDFWALKDISFNVKAGESFAILGKNGAGKSTLLQLLSGIYRPDEGSVHRNGKVGLLQLGTGFHHEHTGRENIYLNGAILGLKRKEIDSIYDSIVAFSELERFIDISIRNYSSGMVSRLAFAIAVNIRPDILLIDEVLSVGDESFRQKCRGKLLQFRKMGKTIILVSHALNDIKEICDRAICLNEGRMVYAGSSLDAVDYYKKSVASGPPKITAATGISLDADPSSPQPAGVPVTFNAQGQPAGVDYEYRFWIKSGKAWSLARNWGDNSWVWSSPVTPGNHSITVYVRRVGSTAARETSTSIRYKLVATDSIKQKDRAAQKE